MNLALSKKAIKEKNSLQLRKIVAGTMIISCVRKITESPLLQYRRIVKGNGGMCCTEGLREGRTRVDALRSCGTKVSVIISACLGEAIQPSLISDIFAATGG